MQQSERHNPNKAIICFSVMIGHEKHEKIARQNLRKIPLSLNIRVYLKTTSRSTS